MLLLTLSVSKVGGAANGTANSGNRELFDGLGGGNGY